jgi:hypothetical protein
MPIVDCKHTHFSIKICITLYIIRLKPPFSPVMIQKNSMEHGTSPCIHAIMQSEWWAKAHPTRSIVLSFFDWVGAGPHLPIYSFSHLLFFFILDSCFLILALSHSPFLRSSVSFFRGQLSAVSGLFMQPYIHASLPSWNLAPALRALLSASDSTTL